MISNSFLSNKKVTSLELYKVNKGVLNQSESDAIFKEADESYDKEFTQYHKVKDID
jgi:hypothetical protein